MSRRSRSDAFMRIWMNFSDLPTEDQLVVFEQKIRGFITEEFGYTVRALEFDVKDDRVRHKPD